LELLSVAQDAKTIKGQSRGVLTGILYLAPSDTSGVANVCVFASQGCKDTCLNTSGRAAIFPAILQARVRKTRLLFSDRQEFIRLLVKDVQSLIKKANRLGMVPMLRVNGTSDLPWLGKLISEMFPDLACYDYTKVPEPWKRTLANYHLTFSHSENNWDACLQALQHNVNVAMVFDVRRGQPLPESYRGFEILDGDLTDLRPLDAKQGVIIGLRAKGRAKSDCSGFVVRLQSPALVQIGTLPALA
jgi:hypothetical protein